MSPPGPRLRLFGFRLSPFVEKVARVLAYKGLAFEEVRPSTPLDMARWSPETRKMPVLEIDGERVHDSTLILRRLDERVPSPALFARDPRAAAAQRLLEDWADEALYWAIMALRFSSAHVAETTEQLAATAPAWLRPLARLAIPRQIGGMTRAQGLGRLPAALLVAEIGHRLDDLVQVLGERPFFFGDDPGAADFAVFGQLATAASGPTPEIPRLLEHRPRLVAWRGRVASHSGG